MAHAIAIAKANATQRSDTTRHDKKGSKRRGEAIDSRAPPYGWLQEQQLRIKGKRRNGNGDCDGDDDDYVDGNCDADVDVDHEI